MYDNILTFLVSNTTYILKKESLANVMSKATNLTIAAFYIVSVK